MRFHAKWIPSVLTASLFLFVFLLSMTVITPAGASAAVLNADEQQMVNLVNQARNAAGLPALTCDATLSGLAKIKAQDMAANSYFNNISPTYGSAFDMMSKAGIQYRYAGENLVKASSVSSAYNALMFAGGHRANMLSTNFDRIGVGIITQGYYKVVVQMFTGGQKTTTVSQAPTAPSQTAAGLNADEQAMFDLVNQERAKAGLKPLEIDITLVKVARLKAQDMIDRGYFSHTSPIYGSPFDMMKTYGVQYSYAGENLAGAPTVQGAHTSLMNSSGHRANILNANYTRVGIGVVSGGPYGKAFVQMFIKPISTKPSSPQEPAQPQEPSPPQEPAQPQEPSPPQEPAQPQEPSPLQEPAQPQEPSPPQEPTQPQTPEPAPDTSGLNADEQAMFNLVNQERYKAGLRPLQADMTLVKVARLKAQDMIDRGYFGHTSPIYGSPFDMMKTYGVQYSYAGENLAGAPTVQSAHTSLMNSSGHRANILDANYTRVGIGVVSGGPYGKAFVQMFTG